MATRPTLTTLSARLSSLSLKNISARRTAYTVSKRKVIQSPSTIIRVKQLAKRANAPPFPYENGLKRFYKQQNLGLYGGLTIRTGHNVSHKTETKTRRAWRPNIQHKRLWSHALGKFLHLKVATRVLRTIDKSGGLDDYLLGEKRARIEELGMHGWLLRWRIMQTPLIQRKFAEQRQAFETQYGITLENPIQSAKALFLEPLSEETLFDENGQSITEQERDAKVADVDRQLAEAEKVAEREQLAEDRSFMAEESAPKDTVQIRA